MNLRGLAVLFVLFAFTGWYVSEPAHAWVFPPYQEIIVFSPAISQGNTYLVQGTENVTSLRYWLTGPDTLSVTQEPVNPQNAFTYVLYPAETRNLTPGEYHLVIEFPGIDGSYDLNFAGNTVIDTTNMSGTGFLFSLNSIGGSPIAPSAALALLTGALNNPAVNDTYTDYVFSVTGAQGSAIATGSSLTGSISVNPVVLFDDNDTMAVNGTSSLPAGETLDVMIRHEPLAGVKCTSDIPFCGEYIGSTVIANDTTWNFSANTSLFWSGNYTVFITAENDNVGTAVTQFTSPPVILPSSSFMPRRFNFFFRAM